MTNRAIAATIERPVARLQETFSTMDEDHQGFERMGAEALASIPRAAMR